MEGSPRAHYSTTHSTSFLSSAGRLLLCQTIASKSTFTIHQDYGAILEVQSVQLWMAVAKGHSFRVTTDGELKRTLLYL